MPKCGSHPRDSDLIGLRWRPSAGVCQSSPDDANAHAKVSCYQDRVSTAQPVSQAPGAVGGTQQVSGSAGGLLRCLVGLCH